MGKFYRQLERELTLYVRHMAWLHATPRPPEGTKRAAQLRAGSQRSRLQALKANGVEPLMPPNPIPQLVNWLIEVGLAEAVGMGLGPISWLSINEWQKATCIALNPWQARLLRRLSVEYVSMGRKAESENCPPPFYAPVTQAEIDAETEGLKALFGM